MAVEITQNLTQVTISSAGVQGLKGETGPAGASADSSVLVTTSSFNEFTSSYTTDSASFATRINAATNEQDLSVFTTTSSFNQFTSSIQSEVNSIKAWTASLELINTIDTELLQFYQTTASLNTQTGSQNSINLGISIVTGSLIGITNGLMAFTAALDSTYASDVQLLPILQATRSIELHSGSMIGITNELMAYTSSNESWKDGIRDEISAIEAWTSSLELINTIDTELLQLYQTTASLNSKTGSYATTGSNTFNGNQTINGSIILDNGAVIKDTPNNGISFGYLAGDINQSTQSVAIGNYAGYQNQSNQGIAIGANAGAINQGQRAVALGSLAGSNTQGEYAVAIGNFAAPNNQAANSIVISATGTGLENTTPNSLVIAPIRNTNGDDGVLQYNNTTNEVSYATTLNGITNLATTGSNTFVGDQTISGSLFISGATEFGGDLVPKTARGATLGTNERPFREIYVQSGSINIASDTPGDPNTTLSNVGGNILVSAGGMRLIGDASFIAATGSFQYISGSMTQVGNYERFGDTLLIGNQITTGSLKVSGSTIMIGDNTMVGNTELTGSFDISGSVTITNIDSAWNFREDGVLKLNDGTAEIYADPNEYSLRIGTAAENVAPNTQIILGGSQSFKIKSGPPLRQWDFDSINGDFNLTGSINGAGNLATTGSNTFVGNQHIIGSVTASVVSSSYMKFDSISNGDTPSYQEGLLYYDTDLGALTFYNNEADIALQIGQEQYIRAINKSGGDILNGTPVRVSGSQGDRVKIYKAEAFIHTGSYNTGETENHIVGITTHDILNDEDGYVTISGLVKGINTSNYNAGDVLYVQTGSAGVLTNSAPVFPYDKIQVGIVSRKHASVGEILVLPKEPTHFGNITGLSGSLTNEVGDLWVYKSNNAWATSKTLEGDYTITGSIDIVGSGSLNGDNIVASNTIMKIETISSASYAALNPPVSGTLYIII